MVLAPVLVGLLGTGCSAPDQHMAMSKNGPTAAGPGKAASTKPAAPPVKQLPWGGGEIFPKYRVVAFYGAAQTPALGVLGRTSPDAAAQGIRRRAKAYASAGKPVVPAFELIATIANAHPGPSGLYRTRTPHETIRRYLAAARRNKALLLLDVQPGRGDFLTEAKVYEPLLREPDVGLALDPEWKMGPNGVPGKRIGHTDAAKINQVSAWLAGIVEKHRLPQKLFVVHQFTHSMVRDKAKVVRRKGLAMTFHVDGFGGQSIKKRKYAAFTRDRRWNNGFKLFLRQDRNMMRPDQVMRLKPRPDLITYQ
jgi:hypothetical protein